METKGIVESINGNKIVVLPYKSEGCGGCNKCHGGDKYGDPLEFDIDFEVAVGEEVVFYINDSAVFQAGFLIYVLPILFFFFGYFISSKFTVVESYKIISSFTAIVLSFIIIAIFNKYIGNKKQSKIEIRKSQA